MGLSDERTGPAAPPSSAFERIWRDYARVFAETSSLDTLFVVGPQRSGTTWVQLLLDAHPECACKFEIRLHDALMAEAHRMVGSYNALISQHSRQVPPWAGAETRMLDQTRLMLLMRLMFLTHFFPLPKPGLRYVGEKTPENLLGLSDIEAVFPEARYIVVVRDGRDAGLSSWHHFRNHGSADLPLASFLKRWVAEHWSPLVNAALDLRRRRPDQSLLVRYEDLVARPEQTASAIFGFLGIDTSKATMARCLEATSFQKVSGGRAAGEERRDQFFRKGVVGDWRAAFGAAELAAFSEVGAAINRLLGYLG
ncbi:MAG: sulfotransferase [Alphaproteobacteria bacterium]|nr:sulfotransferase [Alphaproteobacteria bacterium]